MLTAPAFVLRPNNVPCGPRSTSTRSISTKLDLLEAETVLPHAVDIEADARQAASIANCACAPPVPGFNTTFGTMMPRSRPFVMPPSSSCSAVNAWIDTGVFLQVRLAARGRDDDFF